MSRVKKSAEEIEEAKLLGKALAALRVSRGMTQGQVAAQAGLTPQRICKAERGSCYPQRSHLKRILAGMGVTFAALHRAQELVADPMGEVAEPIDAPDFTPEEAHQAAVRLAQEAGKAVAHCCLHGRSNQEVAQEFQAPAAAAASPEAPLTLARSRPAAAGPPHAQPGPRPAAGGRRLVRGRPR